ncbi:MAG: DNA-damage-inducible protein d [Candidatus Magasanikbacteria bacterium GW2011_GWC2_40_17]|nr:MAG: DNA-damage-inducible protein d [Candidatus Magasanikbacteria bacterium GW2011_GWC2_40_17]
MKKSNSVILFNQKQVRRYYDEKKEIWYFSIIDVIEVLTDTSIPRRYWSDLKSKLKNEGSEVYEKIVQLKMTAPDGKQRETDSFSTEDLLRVIQSVPSPKAEPFKLWLAKVGYERIEETEDPELAFERAMKTYLQKGYSKEWINQRLKSIEVRKELTDEWKE